MTIYVPPLSSEIGAPWAARIHDGLVQALELNGCRVVDSSESRDIDFIWHYQLAPLSRKPFVVFEHVTPFPILDTSYADLTDGASALFVGSRASKKSLEKHTSLPVFACGYPHDNTLLPLYNRSVERDEKLIVIAGRASADNSFYLAIRAAVELFIPCGYRVVFSVLPNLPLPCSVSALASANIEVQMNTQEDYWHLCLQAGVVLNFSALGTNCLSTYEAHKLGAYAVPAAGYNMSPYTSELYLQTFDLLRVSDLLGLLDERPTQEIDESYFTPRPVGQRIVRALKQLLSR